MTRRSPGLIASILDILDHLLPNNLPLAVHVCYGYSDGILARLRSLPTLQVRGVSRYTLLVSPLDPVLRGLVVRRSRAVAGKWHHLLCHHVRVTHACIIATDNCLRRTTLLRSYTLVVRVLPFKTYTNYFSSLLLLLQHGPSSIERTLIHLFYLALRAAKASATCLSCIIKLICGLARVV